MKWLDSTNKFLFTERFSFFDFLFLFIVIELIKISFWWVLAILPLTLVSAALTLWSEDREKNKE